MQFLPLEALMDDLSLEHHDNWTEGMLQQQTLFRLKTVAFSSPGLRTFWLFNWPGEKIESGEAPLHHVHLPTEPPGCQKICIVDLSPDPVQVSANAQDNEETPTHEQMSLASGLVDLYSETAGQSTPVARQPVPSPAEKVYCVRLVSDRNTP